MPHFALLVLFGCAVDNGVHRTGDDPAAFDEGTSPPDTDTSPSDDTGVSTSACADASWPAVPLATRDFSGGSVTPSWRLVEKWSHLDLGRTPGSPVIARIVDTDGDGAIDADDIPSVVVSAEESGTWAFSGADGSVVWQGNDPRPSATPAIGDLDGDGFPEVVVGGAGVSILSGTDGTVQWRGAIDPYSRWSIADSALGIADLDEDGAPEVFVGPEIFASDGAVDPVIGQYGSGLGYIGMHSVAADIDQDGDQEVVTGNTVYDIDGNVIASWEGDDAYVALANFDDDDGPEIVRTRAAVASVSDGNIELLDDDGTLLWSASLGEPAGFGPPVVADFDGDGEPEVAAAYAVYDGSGTLVVDTDGTILWQSLRSSEYFIGGAAGYDLDGDGSWEVIGNQNNELTIFDGATGRVLASWSHERSPWANDAGPTVADLDLDGHAEIAFNIASCDSGRSGVVVLEDAADAFASAETIWNQDAWSVDNVTELGAIPANPAPSWLDENTFRAGPATHAATAAGNLLGVIQDVCVLDCAAGGVTLWYSVGNDGTEPIVAPFSVTVLGLGDAGWVELGTTRWTAGVPAGQLSASDSLRLEGVPSPLYDLELVVDGGSVDAGEVSEGDETDNVASWGNVVCN